MPTISGTVLTNSNPPTSISDVEITLSNSSFRIVSHTNFQGEYFLFGVPPGQYTLTAYYPPLALFEKKAIQVLDENITENFRTNHLGLQMSSPTPYSTLKYFQYAFMGCLGLIFFAVIAYGILSFDINTLDDEKATRGIISYLISVATIGMATILMFAAIMTGGKDLGIRFDLGKQVLTSLIGVLGTVIGFYFGATAKSGGSENPIKIESASLLPSQAQKDDTLTLKFTIAGGMPPYEFAITDGSGMIEHISGKKSNVANVSVQLRAIKSISTGIPVTVSIEGIDSDNSTFSYALQQNK